jgi:4-hydroxy-tetrahydrodipicolinate synthase
MTIDPSVIEHLRVFPNVVGIKDSSGNRERLSALLDAYGDDPGFSVLVGSTALASFGFRNGADGFVPSAANLNPALCVRLYASAVKGDWTLMDDLQRSVDAVQSEMTGETIGRGVARLKRLMQKRGLCGPRVFLPLQEEP